MSEYYLKERLLKSLDFNINSNAIKGRDLFTYRQNLLFKSVSSLPYVALTIPALVFMGAAIFRREVDLDSAIFHLVIFLFVGHFFSVHKFLVPKQVVTHFLYACLLRLFASLFNSLVNPLPALIHLFGLFVIWTVRYINVRKTLLEKGSILRTKDFWFGYDFAKFEKEVVKPYSTLSKLE